MMSPPGAKVVVDGKTYDYFGGTGYLGLQGHPEVIEAACRAARSFGVHTATSRTRSPVFDQGRPPEPRLRARNATATEAMPLATAIAA